MYLLYWLWLLIIIQTIKQLCRGAFTSFPTCCGHKKDCCKYHCTEMQWFDIFTELCNAKECLNYHTAVLISHASKVMLKILPARLQQFMNQKLPDVQAGFRKGKGTRGQIANTCWIIEKEREFQKNIYFYFTG